MKQGDNLGLAGMVLGIVSVVIVIPYLLNFWLVYSFLLFNPIFLWIIIGTCSGGLILSIFAVSIDGSKFGIVGNICSPIALSLLLAAII